MPLAAGDKIVNLKDYHEAPAPSWQALPRSRCGPSKLPGGWIHQHPAVLTRRDPASDLVLAALFLLLFTPGLGLLFFGNRRCGRRGLGLRRRRSFGGLLGRRRGF